MIGDWRLWCATEFSTSFNTVEHSIIHIKVGAELQSQQITFVLMTQRRQLKKACHLSISNEVAIQNKDQQMAYPVASGMPLLRRHNIEHHKCGLGESRPMARTIPWHKHPNEVAATRERENPDEDVGSKELHAGRQSWKERPSARGQSASSARWRRSSSLFSRRLSPAAAAGEYVPVPACADIAWCYAREPPPAAWAPGLTTAGAGLAAEPEWFDGVCLLLPPVAFARVFAMLGPKYGPAFQLLHEMRPKRCYIWASLLQ
jgi:hypothetical protein